MLNKKIISIALCTTLIGVALNAKEHDNYQDDGNAFQNLSEGF